MTNPEEDSANVFAVPDLWRTSHRLDQLPRDDDSSFFASKLHDNTSHLSKFSVNYEPTKPSPDSFFRIPQLDPDEKDTTTQDIAADAQTEHSDSLEPDLTSDLWEDVDQPPTNQPALRTWDAFLQRAPSNAQPLLLTEAGPEAYDAVLSWNIDPLELQNKEVRAIDSSTYFNSLLALALGRESLLFMKSEDGSYFKPVLSPMRISGFSADVLHGLQAQCLTCSRFILDLRGFVHTTYSKNTSRCSVALASVLDEVLQAIQQSIVGPRRAPKSLLLLQATTKSIHSILAPFHGLIKRIARHTSDEAIVSLIYEDVCSVENREPWLLDIMQEVLCRVSRPWVDFIEEWIGTRYEEGVALSKDSVGESKGFVKIEAEVYVDDHGDEVEDVDFRLDRSKMPNFVPDDLAQAIFETGRNLRFLRESHPEHPLCQPGAIDLNKPPKTEWLYDWDAILDLQSQVSLYRKRLLDFVADAQSGRHGTSAALTRGTTGTLPTLDLFGLDEQGMEARILASMNHLDGTVTSRAVESRLSMIIRERLANRSLVSLERNKTRPHHSLLPVLSFGSIVAVQAVVIHRETMRELFRSHDLHGHLKLQRDFQLMGNGLFSSRLSHALFDPDLERADRQAGVARQGGVMGLRLGGRDVWPPASSELRLALSGVLAECYQSGVAHEHIPVSISRDAVDLPGDLSFAVRDLSSEEIERCMDPNSLEALDFLRLSYKAPPELHFIITPMILMHYDRVFRYLVRNLRMVFVTDTLWREAMSCSDENDEAAYRFVREARHFVSSLSSYFLDIGIAGPWAAFEQKLQRIQTSLDTEQNEQLESPEQLREFHSNVLQAIMTVLFLRKRQQPILKLLEDVFAVILQYAKISRLRRMGTVPSDAMSPAQFYQQFKKKVQLFVTVCRGLTEKSRAGTNKVDLAGDSLGDDSMIAHLLIKLDINDYYTK